MAAKTDHVDYIVVAVPLDIEIYPSLMSFKVHGDPSTLNSILYTFSELSQPAEFIVKEKWILNKLQIILKGRNFKIECNVM